MVLAACGAPPGDLPADGREGVPPGDAAAGGDAPELDGPGDAAAGGEDAALIDAPVDAGGGVDAAEDAGDPADAGPDAAPPPDGEVPLDPGVRLTEVALSIGDVKGGRISGNPYGLGSGAALGDIDGDGDVDLVLTRCDDVDGGPTLLLHNDGFPTVTSDATFAAGLAGRCVHGAAFGDYDRDGDLDLFLGMYGPDRLYANDGAGHFTDVTAVAGVAGPATDATTGAVWADLDRDGLLDLFVVQYVRAVPPGPEAVTADRIYRNLGDGTFREIAAGTPAAGSGAGQAVLFSDLDHDGELEIYVANDNFSIEGQGGVTTLDVDRWLDPTGFDGQGVPTYVDRATAYGVDDSRSAMGIAMADLDRDGWDDLYVADWGSNHLQMWNPVAGAYDLVDQVWGLRRTRNPMDWYNISWGVRFTDLDHDGWEEVFIINGTPTEALNCMGWSQLDLFLDRPAGVDKFTNATASLPWPDQYACPPVAGIPLVGRAVLLGDLDGDGDDDVIVTPYREKFRFWRNDTVSGNHRVRVRPHGTVTAPDPVGAELEVEAGGVTYRKVLYGGGDPYSNSDRVVEVGIAGSTSVTRATLRWPSGYAQRLDLGAGFALDAELEITEPEWLSLSQRFTSAGGPVPVITYRPVDASGAPLGAAAAGQTVTATRSDGVAVAFVWNGVDAWTALLPHPGVARVTVVHVSVDGAPLGPRPAICYF